MKSLITASVLFCILLTFVCINTLVLDNFFNDITYKLEELPTELEEIDGMSKQDHQAVLAALEQIKDKWKDFETYIYFSLEHVESREFFTAFLPAIAYYENKEYSQFLAQIKTAKDSIEHLKFDEGIELSNIL